MDIAAAVQLKAMLEGVALPAEKAHLLEYAVRQRAEPAQLDMLRSLPDRAFDSLDEVVEELLRVQPMRPHATPQTPREESGQPPGGDDYTRTDPDDTGQVPDLDEAED
jgi:hypothetical protein